MKLTHSINHHSMETGNCSYPSNPDSSPWLSQLPGEVVTCLEWMFGLTWRTWKNKHSARLKWCQIFCCNRKIFPVFLNPLLSRLVPAIPLLFGIRSQGWPKNPPLTGSSLGYRKQPGKTLHMKLMPVRLCLVWLVQRFLNQLPKLHLVYKSLWFDMSYVGERDDFHLILTKQASTTSSFPLFHFNKQWI